MAILVTNCPHCGIGKTGFTIFGHEIWPESTKQKSSASHGHLYRANVSAGCPDCHRPVCATIRTKTAYSMPQQVDEIFQKASRQTISITSLDFIVIDVWPAPAEPRVPAHLPATTESAFLQAERAFARGDTDAAGMMYRRALETGLKVAFPHVTGQLYQRITELVASHDLPPALGEWAHEVRLIGNEAAHDVDSLSSDDMIATRNFVDAVLRYAISLPEEIAIRRAATPPDPA